MTWPGLAPRSQDAARVAQFYEGIFGSPVLRDETTVGSSRHRRHCEPRVITAIASIASALMCAARAKGRAAVCVGPSVHLLFSTAPVRPVPRTAAS